MTSTSFGGQRSIPKKIKQNDYLRTGEKVLPCPLLSRTLWTPANGGAKFVILCDPASQLQGIQEAFELSESTVPR